MDALTLSTGLFALLLACVAAYAKYIGNEKRDVAALGVCSGFFGLAALGAYLV